VTEEAQFQPGTQIRIELSSTVMEFSGSVRKVIAPDGCDTTFHGMPKPFVLPGQHAAVLSISDEHGDQELLSIPFMVTIADYAFDHISRPFAGRVIVGVVGAVSVCLLTLALITRTAQALDAASGSAGLAFSAFIFTRVNNLYRSRANSVQGYLQDPPSQ
jgi:hypothetical protein